MTLLGTGGNLVNFKQYDSAGTADWQTYPVVAGQNSYCVWLRGYYTSAAAFTITNTKFWNYAAYTANATVYGTTQSAYAQATGTATASNQASNVAVPTSANSTSAPTNPLGLGTLGATGSGSGYTPSYVCMQLAAASDAPAGALGTTGFTLDSGASSRKACRKLGYMLGRLFEFISREVFVTPQRLHAELPFSLGMMI